MPSNKHVYQSPVARSIPFDNSTNGFTSTDVQSAIEEAGAAVKHLTVSATGQVTTTSSTYSLMTGMSITPPAGKYVAIFSGAMYNTGANGTGEYAMFIGSTQSHTRGITTNVQILGLITLSTASFRIGGEIAGAVTMNGTDALTVQFRRTSANDSIGCEQRTLTLIKVVD